MVQCLTAELERLALPFAARPPSRRDLFDLARLDLQIREIGNRMALVLLGHKMNILM